MTVFPVSLRLGWQCPRLPTDYVNMAKVPHRAHDTRPCPRHVRMRVGVPGNVKASDASLVAGPPRGLLTLPRAWYGSRTWCCELGGWCLGVAGAILLRNGRA